MKARSHSKLMAAIAAAGLLAGLAGAGAQTLEKEASNDYPTLARADYIFGCMQVNGNTRLALERCSCSIDVIATLLPYNAYEQAETILGVRQRGGESVAYMNNPASQRIVHELKLAQVEGELRCF